MSGNAWMSFFDPSNTLMDLCNGFGSPWLGQCRFCSLHICLKTRGELRAKFNLKFRRQYSRPRNPQDNILHDQIGALTVYYSRKTYPEQLRRVKARDPETGEPIVLLTNNLTLDSKTITDLYCYRWKIELFFKWIKQHLWVKVFWGEFPNVVKMQIWVALITYLLVAIARKRLKVERSTYEILQILSVSTF